MKKKIIIACAVMAALLIAAGGYVAYQFQQFMKVEVIKVDPLLTVYKGAGNSIVLATKDGKKALIVDTKLRSAAGLLRKGVTATDITIVNTHDHSDHTGGNALYPGATIIAGAYEKAQWDADSGGEAYPARTVKVGEEIVMAFGDETVVIRNMGRAHTTNDTVVFLKNRRLLVTGDLVFKDQHPALLKKSGTSVAAWIKVLDDLYARFDAKTVVPGHGPLTERNAILEMKEYFTSIGDAIGNNEKLDALKEKYRGYGSMPIMMNFKATVSFIKEEKEKK